MADNALTLASGRLQKSRSSRCGQERQFSIISKPYGVRMVVRPAIILPSSLLAEVLRSSGLAAGIKLSVNQGSSFRLSSGVFTIPPTLSYRSLVIELWNALVHA